MNTNDNNQHQKAGNGVTTLRHLHVFLSKANVPATRRAELRSALKKAAKLVGDGTMDQAADLRAVLTGLEKYSPTMAGLSSRGFANLKARVRAAFRLAKPEIVTVRNVKLGDSWRQLTDGLSRKHRDGMSQFMRFCSFHQIEPADVRNDHIQKYRRYLRDAGTPTSKEEALIRDTIRMWNSLCGTSANAAVHDLTPPEPKRTSYWISRENWPPSLNTEVDQFISSLVSPSPLQKTKAPKLRPATIEQYEYVLITVVSALVARGDALSEMMSLEQVVTANRVERAIEFLIDRGGGRVTRRMATIAARCRRAAEWCKMRDDALEELNDLVERVECAAETQKGMTEKNKALISCLDDPRFRDLVQVLPLTLMHRARATKSRATSVSYALTAVAVEILLVCSVRRSNLSNLELGKNIKKLGLGKDTIWVIEFPPQDVKNGFPLRFELMPQSAELLEEYLEHWRPMLCETPNAWLFPASDGGRTKARSLAASIAAKAEAELGVMITPHQFRHISAALYVGDDPSRLPIVSEHLGHASVDTTRQYYLPRQQRAASRLYQERLNLDRARAIERVKGGERKRRPKLHRKKGDEL